MMAAARPVRPPPLNANANKDEIHAYGQLMLRYYTECTHHDAQTNGPMTAPVDTFNLEKHLRDTQALVTPQASSTGPIPMVRQMSHRATDFKTEADYNRYMNGKGYPGPPLFREETNSRLNEQRLKRRRTLYGPKP